MKDPLIVAFGGGVNSTAMLVEMSRRLIVPDLILFADTGGERPETYDAVAAVDRWGVETFGVGIVVVKKTYKGAFESLEQNCLRMKALPSIAYGFKTCSQKYKQDPQDVFVNNWAPAVSAWRDGCVVRRAIGFDAGEPRRAKPVLNSKYHNWYPLIEWDIDRDRCVEICKEAGLPTAKSSCFFCPSMKKPEIIDLAKTNPALLRRALDMEANAELTSIKGLGRSYSWKEFVQTMGSNACSMGQDFSPETPCGCYDG